MYEIPLGIPIHNIIATNETFSKSLIVNEHATYNNATGNEIYPIILCAKSHVSLSFTVQGNLNPVCLVNNNSRQNTAS